MQIPDDTDKPTEKCKYCKPGAGEVVDVSGATDPGGVDSIKYLTIKYIAPSHWGLTDADIPVTDISAYCAGTTWKVRVTQADSQLYEGWQLLTVPNQVVEVTTDLISNTSQCDILKLMKSNLNEIANQGKNDASYFYYISEAVHKHEDIHVDQYKIGCNQVGCNQDFTGIDKAFYEFMEKINNLEIPIEDASNAVDALDKIRKLPDYQKAIQKFTFDHFDVIKKTAPHVPIAPFIYAEHLVVDSKISEIDLRLKTLHCK